MPRRRTKTKKLTEARLKRLYWKKGLSMREIAREHGVCVSTVWQLMCNYGIPRRSTGPRGAGKLTEKDVRSILRKTKKTGGELAREYGVTRQTISLIRRREIWEHVE